MLANRSSNTGPERALRRLLHASGLRYRVAKRPLKGVRRTADIVFTRSKVAVFVDGCFWHSCPLHSTVPKTNVEYWRPKLQRNVQRDRETDQLLENAGWISVRVWEHEDPQTAAKRVADIVDARRKEAR